MKVSWRLHEIIVLSSQYVLIGIMYINKRVYVLGSNILTQFCYLLPYFVSSDYQLLYLQILILYIIIYIFGNYIWSIYAKHNTVWHISELHIDTVTFFSNFWHLENICFVLDSIYQLIFFWQKPSESSMIIISIL